MEGIKRRKKGILIAVNDRPNSTLVDFEHLYWIESMSRSQLIFLVILQNLLKKHTLGKWFLALMYILDELKQFFFSTYFKVVTLNSSQMLYDMILLPNSLSGLIEKKYRRLTFKIYFYHAPKHLTGIVRLLFGWRIFFYHPTACPQNPQISTRL